MVLTLASRTLSFRLIMFKHHVNYAFPHTQDIPTTECKDSKTRFLRWVLLLQEFDFVVKDKRGCENQVADHLSRLKAEKKGEVELDIDDSFPDEQVLASTLDIIHWFADFSNYLSSDLMPKGLTFQQRKKFLHDVQACHSSPVGDTMEVLALPTKCSKADAIGIQFIKMHSIWLKGVICVKGKGPLPVVMS
ncbi:hypothetical protein MTR67_044628 [Solanum verrucosum]|uniref:Reverse transcriptase RNase H-like domain-containing protein n=1 Tax=Solanum verrucosum TaxID=315347 RepID=A0AAF0ZVF7_SOLVR|nr:hypothetical protein MTR67_044628 [Solanum verrucosum]